MEAETLLAEYFIDRYARKAGKNIKRVNKKSWQEHKTCQQEDGLLIRYQLHNCRQFVANRCIHPHLCLPDPCICSTRACNEPSFDVGHQQTSRVVVVKEPIHLAVSELHNDFCEYNLARLPEAALSL